MNSSNAGKYDEVVAMANTVIGFKDKFIQADGYYWLGDSYFYKSQFNKAMSSIDKAIELDPKNAGSFLTKGNINMALKNYKKAVENFDKAIEINPKNSYPYYLKSSALFDDGKYEAAIVSLNKYIELEPIKYATVYDLRAQAKLNLNYNVSAIADFNSAIAIDSTNAYYYNFRGLTLERVKAYEAAIKDYDKAISLKQLEAYPHFRKGSCLLYLGKAEEALLSFTKGEALDTKSTAHIADKNKAIEIFKVLHK